MAVVLVVWVSLPCMVFADSSPPMFPEDPGDTDNSGPDDPDEDEEETTTSTTRVWNILNFPFETLEEAVVNSGASLFLSLYSGDDLSDYDFDDDINTNLKDVMGVVIDSSLAMMLYSPTSEIGSPYAGAGERIGVLQDAQYSSWRTMLGIALMFLPLSLALTVGAALKDGMTSITGYATAREASLQWVFSIVMAGSSFYLISLINYLSIGTARVIATSFLAESVTSMTNVGTVIVSSILGIGAAAPILNPTMLIFILPLAIIIVSCWAIGLTLIVFSREVILLLLTALAPLIFVLGEFQPLRWLRGLWVKGLVVVALLPVANALILGVTVRIASSTVDGTSLAEIVFGMFTMVGMLSILVAVNAASIKLVYGSVIELAKKAWDSAVGVARLAATAAGAIFGMPIAGAIGGGLAGSMAIGGSSPAGGGGGIAASGEGGDAPKTTNPSPASGIGSFGLGAKSSPSFGNTGSVETAALAQKIGTVMQASRNPIVSGFGTGMNVSGAVERSGGSTYFETEPVLGSIRDTLTDQFGQETDYGKTPEEIDNAVGAVRNLWGASYEVGSSPGLMVKSQGFGRGVSTNVAAHQYGVLMGGAYLHGASGIVPSLTPKTAEKNAEFFAIREGMYQGASSGSVSKSDFVNNLSASRFAAKRYGTDKAISEMSKNFDKFIDNYGSRSRSND